MHVRVHGCGAHLEDSLEYTLFRTRTAWSHSPWKKDKTENPLTSFLSQLAGYFPKVNKPISKLSTRSILVCRWYCLRTTHYFDSCSKIQRPPRWERRLSASITSHSRGLLRSVKTISQHPPFSGTVAYDCVSVNKNLIYCETPFDK